MPTLLFLKHKTSLKTTIKSHMEKIWIPFQMIIDLSSFRNHHLEFIIHNSELYRSVATIPLMSSALRGGGDTSADKCEKQVKSPFDS